MKVRSSFNNPCLKDGVVEEKMVSVGPMYFCPKCFDVEFWQTRASDDCYNVPKNNKIFKKWMKIHKKKLK